jgi:predicted RecA/RadA family phage recombinase
MAEAIYVQEGDMLDFTPTVDVPAGQVIVQGDLVGVATVEIKANRLGSLALEGVFDLAKPGTVTFAVGTTVYWDDTANVVTTTSAGNKLLGKVARAAALADPTVRVRLFQ